MCITSHRRTNPIDLNECRMRSLFTGVQKKNLMKSNSLRGSSIQTVHSIQLKFGMFIIDPLPTFCIDFVEFRINIFFAGVQK